MKSLKIVFLSIIGCLLMAVSVCVAQTVKISGDVTKPFTITIASFAAMKHIDVKGKGHDGKEHVYNGVLLADIINEAGALPDNKLSGKSFAKYILIKATDGYRAVIALPEVNAGFNDKNIILADKEDGKPLAEKNRSVSDHHTRRKKMGPLG